MAVAGELGVEHETVLYMKEPPDGDTLEHIVSILEDPVEDLVRKDAKFKKLGLDPDDYVDNPKAVVDVILQHKALMQRPVVVKGESGAGRVHYASPGVLLTAGSHPTEDPTGTSVPRVVERLSAVIERACAVVTATQTATELRPTDGYWMVLDDTRMLEFPHWMGLNVTG